MSFNDYNNLINIIKNRRSTRSFTDQKINNRSIQRIIKAGIFAPSGANSQNQRFLIIDDKKEIKRIGRTRICWPYKNNSKMIIKKPEGIIGNSQVLIIIFTKDTCGIKKEERHIWNTLNSENASASIQNMLLTATSLGIGSCWISFNEMMNHQRPLNWSTYQSIFRNYDLNSNIRPRGIIMLGYPRGGYINGFPKGEKKHGPELNLVMRKKMKFYLIQKKNFSFRRQNFYQKTIIYISKKLIKILLNIVGIINKIIIINE